MCYTWGTVDHSRDLDIGAHCVQHPVQAKYAYYMVFWPRGNLAIIRASKIS
jgi:hypothetical protein